MVIRVRTIFYVLLLAAFCSIPTSAMDFGWGTQELKPSENTKNRKDVLWMTGEIRRGDFEKFRTFVVSNLDELSFVPPVISLSSNGGDVVEALQMASLIRSMYAVVYIGHKEKCASACFYLYVSAVNRAALGSRSLGIHRPYFDSSYFAGLSPAAAEKRYAELTKKINDFLENNYVPRSIIEKMNGTSSEDIVWLTDQEDMNILGGYPPWYEQLLIAKCGYLGAKKQLEIMSRDKTAWETEVSRMADCDLRVRQTEVKLSLRAFLKTTEPATESVPVRPNKNR